MNLAEATELCKSKSALIGKKKDELTITNVLVLPSNSSTRNAALQALYREESIDQYLAREKDFEVIALYDFPYSFRNSGIIFHENVLKINL